MNDTTEPLYYVSTAFTGVAFAVDPEVIPVNATILRPEQVDPSIREQGRTWLAERQAS